MYSPIQYGYGAQNQYGSDNRTCGTYSCGTTDTYGAYGGNGIVAGGCTTGQVPNPPACGPCCEPQRPPVYTAPSYGVGDVAQVFMKLIGDIGHKMAGPVYQFAKDNPMLYGAGVAGLGIGSGVMACPYCGIMLAGLGAMGYMQQPEAAQQQQFPY